ncbi:MAG TPA: orotidine-5'-phosphate decarboxylase [Actinomycetota bacterium]|jgi:orotidine-5'-phosphate decarboxylase|nr:orotidine-5'-phosphate decarboxylase [Actinomycetota bacterium]
MNPLCLAIDTSDGSVVDSLVHATRPYVGMFKVGATTFAALGPPVVIQVAASKPVFCDLKLNDIPSQVEGAIAALGGLGVSYATVHALGGPDMVRAAVKAAPESLKILGVTVLTSLEAGDLARLGIEGSIPETVLRLGEMALEAGVSGLVCPGREVALLRERFGPTTAGGPILVVPGIRHQEGPSGDQQRTSRARAAIDAGADVVVVGRLITHAADPGVTARDILHNLTA